MTNRVFDSNKLIKQLRKLGPDSTPEDAERLANELIVAYETRAIVSPVEIEVLAGVRDFDELELTEKFLQCFEVVDRRNIPPKDWEEAKRIAKRVVKYDREAPRRRRRRDRERNPRTEARDLGDSLIIAIARRLRYEIISDDKDIARQSGRIGPGGE